MKKKKKIDATDSQEFIAKHLGKNITSGDIVRAARLSMSFSQDELAELTGIKKSFISTIENNKRKIGVSSALKIAAATGLHPATILFPKGFMNTDAVKEIERKRNLLLKKKAS